MPSGHAYAKAVRTVKTCVGTEFCRFGLGDAIALGIELERRMEGLYTPHKVKAAVAGCPRNCAEAYVKDIGVVAVEGGWEMYVGGAAGATVRKGDLLATVDRGRARRSGWRSRSCSTTASRRSTSSAPTRTSSGSASRRYARPCWTRRSRRRCSSATRSPRPPPTRIRGASATIRCTQAVRRADASWIVAVSGAMSDTGSTVGTVDDVPLLEGRNVVVEGRRIAVFRLADGCAAIDAACPHAGGPLADGIVADSCVTCPLHGRRFDLRTGARPAATTRSASHEVSERDGELLLRLGASRLAAA